MFYERTIATANAGGRSLTEPCFKVGDVGVSRRIGMKRIGRLTRSFVSLGSRYRFCSNITPCRTQQKRFFCYLYSR